MDRLHCQGYMANHIPLTAGFKRTHSRRARKISPTINGRPTGKLPGIDNVVSCRRICAAKTPNPVFRWRAANLTSIHITPETRATILPRRLPTTSRPQLQRLDIDKFAENCLFRGEGHKVAVMYKSHRQGLRHASGERESELQWHRRGISLY